MCCRRGGSRDLVSRRGKGRPELSAGCPGPEWAFFGAGSSLFVRTQWRPYCIVPGSDESPTWCRVFLSPGMRWRPGFRSLALDESALKATHETPRASCFLVRHGGALARVSRPLSRGRQGLISQESATTAGLHFGWLSSRWHGIPRPIPPTQARRTLLRDTSSVFAVAAGNHNR